MPSPTFVDSAAATDTSTSGGDLTISVLSSGVSGLTTGDELLAWATFDFGQNAPQVTGWTKLAEVVDSGGGARTTVYRRTATGSEPSSWQWTVAGILGVQITGYVLVGAWRGVHVETPVAAAAMVPSPASTKSTAPSVESTTTAGRLVCGFSSPGSTTSWTAPSGMTSVGLAGRVFVVHAQVVTLGATGTKTATKLASTAGHAGTVLLLPANRPPNAPTVLIAGKTGGTVDVSAATTRVQFSDPDVGDGPTAVAIEVTEDGGASQFVDLAGPTLGGTEVKNVTTAQDFDLSAVITNGSDWQVRGKHWDQDDTEGVYGSFQAFTASARPSLSWTSEALVDDNATPTRTWNYADAEGDLQQAWRVLVFPALLADETDMTLVSDPAVWAGEAVFDSGRVLSAAEQVTLPALVNGDYVAWGYVEQTGELRSAWTLDEFTMDLPPPAAPSLVVSFNDGTGRIVVAIQTSANLLTEALYSGSTSIASWSSADAALTLEADGSMNVERT